VSVLRYSPQAENDLLEISLYTLFTWSENQAEKYLSDIHECVRMLAGNPRLGRSCEDIRTGLRRFEKGRHVIFYRRNPSGILVVRILHQSMLPEPQFFEEAEEN
jgi:toxin ParE1/3/4